MQSFLFCLLSFSHSSFALFSFCHQSKHQGNKLINTKILPLDLWQDSTTQQGQAVQQNQQPHAQATEGRMRVMYQSPLSGPVPMSLLKLLHIPLETVWEASAQTLCRAVKVQTLALPAPILLTWSHALLEQTVWYSLTCCLLWILPQEARRSSLQPVRTQGNTEVRRL